jgi:hypothetical protein
VNFMTEEETGRVSAAYGQGYARLAEVKKHYDPLSSRSREREPGRVIRQIFQEWILIVRPKTDTQVAQSTDEGSGDHPALSQVRRTATSPVLPS